jgi:3-hydroxy-3-methylglutaryl CoA synthase
MGWLNPATLLPGEKAVANYDEDSLTMAVAASMDCLKGVDRDKIDGVYFASISLPYKERQNAGIIATALNLGSAIRTADFTGSTRSGTTALLAACDSIEAGTSRNILVCAADCCAGKPGGAQEEANGDAGAAFLLGEEGVIANLQASHSLSYDFVDRWMADFDKFERVWEDRWIRDEAYNKFIPEAISTLAKKCNLSPKDIAKAGYPCLYVEDHANIGKRVGLEPAQVQEHLFNSVGNSGTAYPLILMVAALEDANPKDNVVIASFGSGSEALLFQTTEKIVDIKDKRKGVKNHLTSKQMLPSYEKYAIFRGLIDVEKGIRGGTVPWEQKSLSWRYRDSLLGLVGSRCKRCGTPQFPPQVVCVKPTCKAVHEMEPYRFSERKGQLFTYTGDSLAFSLNPPAVYGAVDFDGGGRYWFDLTDCQLDALKVGMPVEMSLRRKFIDQKMGTYFYFWKAVPIR